MGRFRSDLVRFQNVLGWFGRFQKVLGRFWVVFNEFFAGLSKVPNRFWIVKEGLKRQLLFPFKVEEFV